MYVVTTIDVGVLGLLRNVSKAEDKINKNILPGILCGCVMLTVRTPHCVWVRNVECMNTTFCVGA